MFVCRWCFSFDVGLVVQRSITPWLSPVTCTGWFLILNLVRKRLEIVTRAVCPCNSPLLDDISCECPSTGPEPEIVNRGFARSSTLPVDNTHAWLVLQSLNEASAAPNSGLFDDWMY